MARNPVQFQKGISLNEFLSLYGTEDQCFDALYQWRWPSGFLCPHCAHHRSCQLNTRKLQQCNRRLHHYINKNNNLCRSYHNSYHRFEKLGWRPLAFSDPFLTTGQPSPPPSPARSATACSLDARGFGTRARRATWRHAGSDLDENIGIGAAGCAFARRTSNASRRSLVRPVLRRPFGKGSAVVRG